MDRTAQPTITFRENFVEIVRNDITGSAYYCQYDNDPAKAVTEETARKPLPLGMGINCGDKVIFCNFL